MNANEATVRNAYQVAERKDYAGWVNCFTEDGTFTDESLGVTYQSLPTWEYPLVEITLVRDFGGM